MGDRSGGAALTGGDGVTGRDRRLMERALDACARGVAAGQSPFGACVARGDEILAVAHNQVWLGLDPTAHAEVQAIRVASWKLGAVRLAGATIYSTTEPCPMCFGAIHWAGIDRIVYGAAIDDARRFGFNELAIANADLRRAGGSRVELVGGVLRERALELFERWRERGASTAY